MFKIFTNLLQELSKTVYEAVCILHKMCGNSSMKIITIALVYYSLLVFLTVTSFIKIGIKIFKRS